jgi:hypothetical protein
MRWMPARRILPRVWQIVLGILLLSIIIGQIFRRNIEPLQNTKGELYLLLEAPGFDVPELKMSKKIMDPNVAKAKFDKVVVVANTAKYKDPKSDGPIMVAQWDNKLVYNLGLPVEKWAFVCCSSTVMPAATLINNLISKFNDIKGFLIDSEDDPSSIAEFIKVFKSKGSAYKYGIVGGLRKTIPPVSKYGITFDKFFGEVYTEGDLAQYNFYKGVDKKVGGATCVSMEKTATKQFWSSVKSKLGLDDAIVPTVCGSGNCQELLYKDDCFDERLSDNNINSLLNGNNTGRKNFAIWYGTGQQFSCEPARTCLKLSSADCSTNKNCYWNQYKKNPNTGKPGVCASMPGNWGCATVW